MSGKLNASYIYEKDGIAVYSTAKFADGKFYYAGIQIVCLDNNSDIDCKRHEIAELKQSKLYERIIETFKAYKASNITLFEMHEIEFTDSVNRGNFIGYIKPNRFNSTHFQYNGVVVSPINMKVLKDMMFALVHDLRHLEY